MNEPETQEQEVVKEEKVPSFATIGEVLEDGVTLIFDGEETATEKHYKCNTSVIFHSGDRVKILPDCGTYVVEYVVGPPAKDEPIEGIVPSGGAAGYVLAKQSNAAYDMLWKFLKGIPSGGGSGQYLRKSSDDNYAVTWANGPLGVPGGGTDGQILARSGYTEGVMKWIDKPIGLPSGGSIGQLLSKGSSGPAWANVYGVPSGGSMDQILGKSSSSNGQFKWMNLPAGVPSGGSSGQVLSRDGSSGLKWITKSGVPSGGKYGQFLQVGGSSYNPQIVWGGAPVPSSVVDRGNTRQSIIFRYYGGKFQIALNSSYPTWKNITA